jgi:acyl-CoA thioester hydrolase
MSQNPTSQSQRPPERGVIDIEIRVRYTECDPMGVVHHSIYPVWMEIARTDLLRRRGKAYRELEAAGVFFVVARMSLRYKRPARYDDILRVHCETLPCAGVKVEHRYEVFRGTELLTTAETTLVCVDRAGKVQPIPAGIMD